MRVSVFERFQVTNRQFSDLQRQLSTQQVQIGSGKKFLKPSDDPVSLNRKRVIELSQNRIEQYKTNIDDSKSFLETVDITIGSTVDALQGAREIGLKAANDTYSNKDLQTFSNEIEQTIEHVLSMANKKHLGRYIFSGEKINTEPFTYTGAAVTYNGDANEQKIEVSAYKDVKLSKTGDDVFENSLNALINLRDQILTGDTANINNAVGQLDNGMEEVINARSEIGVRMKSLDVLADTYEKTALDLEDKRSGIEDVDISEITVDFSRSQMLYQGTIKASTMMMQTSILKFI